jgi:chromosome segregation ATPase
MSIYIKDRNQNNQFNFEEYKKNIYLHLQNRNKNESLPFENIIKNFNDSLSKNKKLVQKVELLERENNSLKRFGAGDANIPNEIQNKIFSLEKELNESIKEKNVNSTKLLEILTEKIQMKDHIDSLTKSNNNKQSRIFELEEIVKTQDDTIIKLKDDCEYLKKELNKFLSQNAILEENYNKKKVENHNLINEILNIKEDYAMKMNDMLELLEQAKKKKEVILLMSIN